MIPGCAVIFSQDTKAETGRVKIDKLNHTKINYTHCNNTTKNANRLPTGGRGAPANHTSDKGPTYRVYKDSHNASNKQAMRLFLMGKGFE